MLRALLLLSVVFALNSSALADRNPASWTPIENQVAQITAGPQVTIVHFWSPQSSQCQAELNRSGWRDFLAVNREVKTIFVTIWSREDGREQLKKAGLDAQPNFQLLLHPNESREAATRVEAFMGEPIQWVPSTWIFKDGQLRYVLNYGEIRFPLLQQLVRDAADRWDHSAPSEK